MTADTTTTIPSLNTPAPPAAVPAGTGRLGLALVVIWMV